MKIFAYVWTQTEVLDAEAYKNLVLQYISYGNKLFITIKYIVTTDVSLLLGKVIFLDYLRCKIYNGKASMCVTQIIAWFYDFHKFQYLKLINRLKHLKISFRLQSTLLKNFSNHRKFKIPL